MAVQIYSLKKDGAKKIATNFEISEFRSKDGVDEIKLDTNLPPYLQVLRDTVKGVNHIEVIGGYRSPAYNKAVKGAVNSQHLQGKAADIKAWKNKNRTAYVDPKLLCCAAEVLGMPGIGMMQTAIHVDVRATKSYFDENYKNTRIENLPGNHKSWFTYFGVKDLSFFKCNPFNKPTGTDISKMTPNEVRYVQFELVKGGYLPLVAANGKCNIDGVAGTGTKNAVMAAGLKVLCK